MSRLLGEIVGSNMWEIHKKLLLNNVFICQRTPAFVFMMLLGRVQFWDSDKMQREGILRNITFSTETDLLKMIQYI